LSAVPRRDGARDLFANQKKYDCCVFLINAQGLASANKLELFKDYIKNFQRPPQVLIITEHWLNNNEVKLLNVMQYKLAAGYGRVQKLRGGVAVIDSA